MKTYEFKFVEAGLIENVHYETHKRGKNWVAVIEGKNSVNFQRDFIGRQFAGTEKLAVGTAFEMAGDYVSGGGIKRTNRGYYLVKEVLEDKIVVEEYSSVAELLKAKNQLQK